MSEGVNESSVILIIKAPNQKIADYEVKCMLDWTVRNLKEHLALVYPTKPVNILLFFAFKLKISKYL